MVLGKVGGKHRQHDAEGDKPDNRGGAPACPPEGKVCEGCDSTVNDLTMLEKQQRCYTDLGTTKTIGGGGGGLCAWCGRMARIRYAHRSAPSLSKMLTQDPIAKDRFKMLSLCYVPTRNEGRTQVTSEMLERRFRVLGQVQELVSVEIPASYMLLTEFLESRQDQADHLDATGLAIVQMKVGGSTAWESRFRHWQVLMVSDCRGKSTSASTSGPRAMSTLRRFEHSKPKRHQWSNRPGRRRAGRHRRRGGRRRLAPERGPRV